MTAVVERSMNGSTAQAAVRTPIHKTLRRLLVLVAVADVVMLCLAAALAWSLRLSFPLLWEAPEPSSATLLGAAPWLILAWLIVLAVHGSYSVRVFGTGPEEFRRVFTSSVITVGLMGLYCYLTKTELSRGFVSMVFLAGVPMLIAERYAVRTATRRLRKRGKLLHRVVAVGGPSGVGELVDVLRREQHVGYRVVGVCVPEGIEAGAESYDVPILGPVSDARRLCADIGADTVLVARGGFGSSADLRKLAWELQGSDIQLVVAPSLTDVAGPRIHMRPVAGLPLLHLEEPQVDEASGWSKRMFDIAGAVAAIFVLAPIMVAVALAIKLEDRGPIIFRQRRVGRHGEIFACFKFRSMYVNAHLREAALREDSGHEGALWKMEKDPRITRVGGFIRRYSLDELPQLFNVVRGEMSLVGPRPQQSWEVDTYTDSVRRRLLVRPGMTGLWQVSGRSQLPLEEAVRLDLYYVDNWSMATDLVIMARTVKAVVGSDGAY